MGMIYLNGQDLLNSRHTNTETPTVIPKFFGGTMTRCGLLLWVLAGVSIGCDDSSAPNAVMFAADAGADAQRATPDMLKPDAMPVIQTPEIVIESPQSGEFYEPMQRTVSVRGQVLNASPLGRLTIGGVQIVFNENGRFESPVELTRGLQHIDVRFEATPDIYDATRRTILVGADIPWDAEVRSALSAIINPSALERLSEALEGPTARMLFQEEVISGTQDDEDLEINEVLYDDIDVNLNLADGFVRAQVILSGLAIRFTYNYAVFGIDTRVRGVARANSAELIADVFIVQDPMGAFGAEIRNPQLNLTEFELELEGAFQTLEGILEPLIRTLAQDGLLSLLDDYLVQTIVEAELLNREIDVLGTPVGLNFELRDLSVTPEMATAAASGRITGVMPVKDAPGIWQAGGSSAPTTGPHDVSLNVGVDILNHLLAHVWRGALLDTVFDGRDPESPTANLTMGVLAGAAAPALLDTFGPDSPISVRTEALLQPTVRFGDPQSFDLNLGIGALRIYLSATDMQGNAREWGVFEVSGDITATPGIDGLALTLMAQTDLNFEVISAPIVPLQEEVFSNFMQSIVDGLITSGLDSAISQIIDLESLDLFGLRLQQIYLQRLIGAPSYLQISIAFDTIQ